eukprot:1709282-Pleurochrysis_carterae.AAC.1
MVKESTSARVCERARVCTRARGRGFGAPRARVGSCGHASPMRLSGVRTKASHARSARDSLIKPSSRLHLNSAHARPARSHRITLPVPSASRYPYPQIHATFTIRFPLPLPSRSRYPYPQIPVTFTFRIRLHVPSASRYPFPQIHATYTLRIPLPVTSDSRYLYLQDPAT